LNNYTGMVFLMPLEKGLSVEQKQALRESIWAVTPYPGCIHMLKALVGIQVRHSARHCMQHIAWLLDEIGLTPEYQLDKGQTFLDIGFFESSCAVTTLTGEPLGVPPNNNRYEDVVQLLCDC